MKFWENVFKEINKILTMRQIYGFLDGKRGDEIFVCLFVVVFMFCGYCVLTLCSYL